MPRSVNKVILVGNVGKDPEVKYSPSGTPVAKFSLATNERFKDRNDQWQDRAEWHNVVAWQRLAEIVGEFVTKGSKITLKAGFRRRVGKTGKAASASIERKLLPVKLCCLASG